MAFCFENPFMGARRPRRVVCSIRDKASRLHSMPNKRRAARRVYFRPESRFLDCEPVCLGGMGVPPMGLKSGTGIPPVFGAASRRLPQGRFGRFQALQKTELPKSLARRRDGVVVNRAHLSGDLWLNR